MSQQVDEATHRDGNTLDLLFTNNADLVHSYLPTYSMLWDHFTVEFKTVYKDCSAEKTLQTCESREDPTFCNLNFFSETIKWDALNSSLQEHNWTLDFRGCTVESMMKKFCSVVLSIAADHVPPRKSKNPSISMIPRHRRILMRTRLRINIQNHLQTSVVKPLCAA